MLSVAFLLHHISSPAKASLNSYHQATGGEKAIFPISQAPILSVHPFSFIFLLSDGKSETDSVVPGVFCHPLG